MEPYGYIYKCTYTVNGKIYVGASRKLSEIDTYLGSGEYWISEVDPYNHRDLIQKEILDYAYSLEDIREKEIYWIEKLDARHPEVGYNIHIGGFGICDMSDDVKSKISRSLSNYRKEHGFSKEHLQKISDHLKGRNIGCNGDTRSIQVYCIVNGEKHTFHSKRVAAKWWYDNYPFSDIYAEITYTRLITKSIDGLPLKYKKESIKQDIRWFEDVFELSADSPVYCLFKDKLFGFDTISEATVWWHKNYPITRIYDEEVYTDKLIKNIKGFEISRNSIAYKEIQWFRKE